MNISNEEAQNWSKAQKEKPSCEDVKNLVELYKEACSQNRFNWEIALKLNFFLYSGCGLVTAFYFQNIQQLSHDNSPIEKYILVVPLTVTYVAFMFFLNATKDAYISSGWHFNYIRTILFQFYIYEEILIDHCKSFKIPKTGVFPVHEICKQNYPLYYYFLLISVSGATVLTTFFTHLLSGAASFSLTFNPLEVPETFYFLNIEVYTISINIILGPLRALINSLSLYRSLKKSMPSKQILS